MVDESTYDIALVRVCGIRPSSETLPRKAVAAALKRQAVRTARISVALVDDAFITQLNLRHLKRDQATDVLAFDLHDPHTQNDRNAWEVEGEIVVSTDTAQREARQRGHSLEAELALYALHGTLHLLGYDDVNDCEAGTMHAIEDEILTAMGLGPVYSRCVP